MCSSRLLIVAFLSLVSLIHAAHLFRLPTDVLHRIYRYLPPNDRRHFRISSRFLRDISADYDQQLDTWLSIHPSYWFQDWPLIEFRPPFYNRFNMLTEHLMIVRRLEDRPSTEAHFSWFINWLVDANNLFQQRIKVLRVFATSNHRRFHPSIMKSTRRLATHGLMGLQRKLVQWLLEDFSFESWSMNRWKSFSLLSDKEKVDRALLLLKVASVFSRFRKSLKLIGLVQRYSATSAFVDRYNYATKELLHYLPACLQDGVSLSYEVLDIVLSLNQTAIPQQQFISKYLHSNKTLNYWDRFNDVVGLLQTHRVPGMEVWSLLASQTLGMFPQALPARIPYTIFLTLSETTQVLLENLFLLFKSTALDRRRWLCGLAQVINLLIAVLSRQLYDSRGADISVLSGTPSDLQLSLARLQKTVNHLTNPFPIHQYNWINNFIGIKDHLDLLRITLIQSIPFSAVVMLRLNALEAYTQE